MGTVLVVDDDESIRKTFSLVLEFQGYRVVTAANGQKALKCLQEMPRPFLILLDLMMPVMDGWTFLSEIKKQPALAEIPVVVITAQAGSLQIPQTAGVIHKPVEMGKFCETVRQFQNH